MPRKRTSRLYRRGARWYADFRDYADVGGRQEALIPPAEKRATTDSTVAEIILARRLEEFEEQRRNRTVLGITRHATLSSYAAEHLIAKARSGKYATETIAAHERYLRRACEYFGTDRPLTAMTVKDVRQWLVHLQKLPNGRQGTLTGWSARHHLGALSNLFRRAGSEGLVPPGFNPAAAILDKPAMPRVEARWLEVHEAALLLEAARTHQPKRGDAAFPAGFELVATFLLTGGRAEEVYGLEVQDVSFDRSTVTFRPNRWRGLKTVTSRRVVPLWPQLEEILRAYVFGADGPPGRLLFPSQRTASRQGRESPVRDCRKYLDAISQRAGWQAGEIRTKMFRHTYCAARLQTLDGGAPVSPFTVSRELGHSSLSMVQKVYAHLGEVRQRGEAVEYRVSNHLERQMHDGQTVEELLRAL